LPRLRIDRATQLREPQGLAALALVKLLKVLDRHPDLLEDVKVA
jgi:hypothetical protein